MACVNRKDSNFKKLTSKYNATSGTVENAIKTYMDKNNLETYDPESQDFIDHMDSYFELRSNNVFTSKREYNKAHKVWESKNPTYMSLNEMEMKSIYSELVEMFGEENVIMYETPTGEYIVRAAEPVFKKEEDIEEVTLPEDIEDSKSTKELVDRMIADSKEHIKFNPEDHSYIVDGKKADVSVTQFIHGKQDLGQWGVAASAIGTTADRATRDFFKGDLKDEYPNLSDKDLSFLKHDLKSLKNFFDKKFGKGKYTVVTEEFPIASKYTYTDSDGNFKEGVMAGTMDMLIYDDEGNFYIYDMKTSRSGLNENKVAGYAKQLSLYKAILEANYPELKGKIKELKLIQFRVSYPRPDNNFIYSEVDGQLYLNNVPIQDTEDYYSPHLDFTGNSLNSQVLVPVEPVDMNVLFEGMTEDEKELMKEETREPENTEFSQNEVDNQRSNLYGNPLLSATERTFLANNVMSLTSFIVTHLQTSPEANQFYFGDQFSKFNFTKMSREDIISTVGVTKIFEYIKERWYNPDNRTDIDDFDILDKLQIAYDNWAALVKSAYAKLITLEGVTVVAARPNEISREDIETSFQEQIDTGELEEKEREYWQLGIRNISARSSLSGDIRRSFERLFAIDSNGNPIKDKFGFNFDTFVDSGVAVNSILEWTRTATTVEEMEEILDGMKDSYPWLNSILNKIKEEPFRSQFFQNFRKDFTQYSIVTVERDEKGNKVYQTQIINTKGASQAILDEITTYYNSGLMQNIIITADGIEGKGRVNVKNVEALKAKKDQIVANLKDAFTAVKREVYNDTLKNSVPKITKLLNELGIRVDTKTVSNTIVGKGRPKDINNSPVMKLLSEMSYIFDTLLSKKDSTSYNPLLKGEEKNIYGNYKSIVGLMSKFIQDSIESSSYENGKMHYSFVTPSYMGKLILNLKDAIGNPNKFNSFIEENYGSYRWFREEDGTWNNVWLELISGDKEARQGLEHKVQLSFDGTPYTDLSELGYTLSLMSEYFYDKGSRGKSPQWAWYRVPMLSNKPSSEFIRFKRYSGAEYKRKIKRGLKMVLNQEILRFKAVLERSANADIEPISNFDISSKILKKNPQIETKIRKGEPLTHDDLVKDGKLVTYSSGASFKFLDAFNQNIVEGDELGMMLIDKINGVKVNEDSFDKLVSQNLDSYMDTIVSKEIAQWEKIGLFDTEEVKRGNDTETRYKYIPNLTRSYSTIKKELFGKERRLSREQKSEIMQVMQSEAKANLEEYVWNDMFATINIIQLTATDLAYYKNVEDFQKRYAQVHSPAMRLNITARDSKGRLYSADGMERTMYISDYEVASDIIPNVEEIFDQKIASISDPSEKANMRMMKDLILESFRKINVADAQGYSSPTSYRKKMGMMGKWSEEMEEAYNRIKKGDFKVNDLGVVWQPMKPFVYSQIRKPGGSNALSELKVPVQNKNSEYLLLLVDALMRGGKKQSKLAAIFDFMEESAYDGRETKFNPETNTYEVIKEGTYNGKGIDTVQFESSVKSGKSGVVNINNAESYEDVKSVLNGAAYINSDRTPSSDNNNDRYNINYIHTIPFEDYGIQQEVPAHLMDHEQLMGSQMRILSISDITPGTEFQIGDETLESDALISEYQNLIKENIEQSFEKLCKDFKVRGTRLERNKALEKILQEAIEKDQRYGADIQRACSLDKNGEFTIPLSDPIQSIRIQQLLNSVIKSRINKQKVTGGPVVQASVFGMSDDLSIRFKDKKGNLIETFSEFIEKRGLSKDETSAAEYKKFIEDKQASVAYFECYMPIPSSELEEALTRYDKDGHPYIMSMEEAVKEGIIPEEMRKAIGYRIPTEDKYSMAPLYIKGFLPKAAGEAVMLPKEITLLSGSDFDIDKLYIMLKTFTLKKRTDWGKLEKDILKSNKATGEEKKKRKEALRMTIEQIKAGMAFSEGTFEMEVYDYYYNHKDRYNRDFFELSDDNTDRRNNRIFDLQWAVLTNPDTMSKMFNPGSFDVQKKTARIVRILQETKGHTYQELSKLNLDQLDEILDSSSDRNIIYSSSQVYFHKQNMTAGKLIGIFANNNTSHAFISMQDIHLNLGDDLKFTFDGYTVDNTHNNKLDALKGKNGSLISKTIAGFLAASVDAVKDPVLNFMNLNTFTSGPAMVLARLGFDSDSIGLLLSQPIIRKVTDEYFRRNNEGYISAEDLIDEFLEQDKNAKGYEKTLTLTNFSKDELAQGISLNSDKGDFQIRALILFKRLSKISQDLNTLTFLTKFNSVTNAVGPTIADTLVMKQRYKKFLDKFEDNNAIFSENAKDVIQNSPILDAFYTTTVSDTGASQLIFQGYFPQYSDKFNQILEKLRETTKATIDSKTINSLVSDFVLYKLTGGPNPVLNSDRKVREEFIHDFIAEFKEEAAGIVGNELIKIITVKPSTGRCPVPTLEAKTGGYTQDVQEKVRDAWTNLIIDESTRDLGIKLFFYNMYRTGLSFSPKTFLHLASTDVKLAIPGYVDSIRDINYNDSFDVNDFLLQYRRNHTDNFKVVPHITQRKGISSSVTEDGAGNRKITFTFASDNVSSQFIVKKVKRKSGKVSVKETIAAPVILYNDKVYFNPDVNLDGSITYTETTTLGNTNNFLEYNMNESGSEIKTSIQRTSTEEDTPKKEVQDSPAREIPEEIGENNATELSKTDVETILSEVLDEDEMDDLVKAASKRQSGKLNKYKNMIEEYTDSETASKVGNQEVGSQLFDELVTYTGDRESAKYIWGLTQVPEFMSSLKGIERDKNGEPTLSSLIKAVDIDSLLDTGISIEGAKKELGAINSKGEPIIYSSTDEIINSVVEFNKKHPKMVADVGSKDGGYVINVEPKTPQNATSPEKLVFNSSLNNQLRGILRRLGFDVEVLNSPRFNAMFSPENARTNAEGLKTVIQIAKGQKGEDAFPEEFSHLMIEGLMNQPLVQRLVNSLGSYEVIKEVLGENFDAYVRLYKGDMEALQKEAAGQLLQKYITGEALPVSRPSLLERLWNWVKSKFGSISEDDIDNIILQANRDASQIASSILDESILPLVDKDLIVNAKTLYNVEKSVSGMEELAQKALEVASKRLEILRLRSRSGRYSEDDLEAIKNIQDLIEKKKYSKSCLAFLSDSLQQLEQLNTNLSKLDANNLNEESDLNRIRKVSSTLRKIKEFSDAYEPIIKQMMSIDAMKERGEVELSDEDAAIIADKATSVFRIINKINSGYKSMRFNTLYSFLKMYWGEDKIIDAGSDKGKRVTLEMIMKMADKDINFLDRYISSMSDASDPMLSLVDKVVKSTQAKRDSVLEDILAGVRNAHTKLSQAGYTTDFMYERDKNGKLTGRLISDIDFVKFKEEYDAEKNRLMSEKLPYYVIKSKLDAWERRHTETVLIDADSNRKEELPKKSLYGIDRISKLAPAQREYYNTMINLKATLDSLIPARFANTFNAVQIRNDVTEAIMDNVTDPKKAGKMVIENLKDNFLRRSDDTDWGDSTIDEGESFLANSKRINLDFSGNPIQKLPVYYTTPLEDMERLSTDFTSSIMAYASMAINYNEMNKVIDVLELTRDLIKEREVQQMSGDSKLIDAFKVVHKKFRKNYTKSGEKTNIGARIDDYYASVLYGQHKKDEGTWNVFGKEVDKAKTVDTLKSYTGALGLGLNLFSAISNVTMGKMQLIIEGMSGEYFNMKDAVVGKKNYYALLPQYMAELNSTKKTSKLGLLIDKFDALEEFYGNLKSQGYYKGPLSRIIGSTNIFFLNNLGEHYLHSRNMLAMLNNVKVKDKSGKEISLFDAFEVKTDSEGVSKLVLKEGVKDLDGKLLSTEGLDRSSESFEEVEKRYENFITNQKLRIGKVNQSLNGAFNETDKGAIHRYSLGRLAMQFRQWMPAHYSRRFSSASYDAKLDHWREGYYRTIGRFALNLMKDISRAKFDLATNWNSLSTHEKANIKRALTELGMFATLAALIAMIGPEKDKKGRWGERMVVYQLKRMQLETGASIPWFSAIENVWTILQSPAVAINSFNGLLDLVKFWNMFDELESGRYKGWSEWERDASQTIPLYGQLRKVFDLSEEDYMYTIFADR